jgi:hypothetical protein
MKDDFTLYLQELPVVDRVSARSAAGPRPLEAWLWGLYKWGQSVQIRACYALAVEAMALWCQLRHAQAQHDWSFSNCLNEGWALLEAWMVKEDRQHLENLKALDQELDNFRHILELNLREGARPKEPYWGGLVCVNTVSVARWDIDCLPRHLMPSDGEYQEQLKVGPSYHVLEVAYCARQALGWTDNQIHSRIRRALMA